MGRRGEGNPGFHLQSGKSVDVVTGDKSRDRVIIPKTLKVAVFEKWERVRLHVLCV